MSAWHPIDTVPKDGTNVLLWTPAGIIEARYRKCLYCDDWWHDWQFSVVDAYSEHVSLELEPTHWMPLPEPPAE